MKPFGVETGLGKLPGIGGPRPESGTSSVSPAKEQMLQVTSAEAETGLSQASVPPFRGPAAGACPQPPAGTGPGCAMVPAALCLFLSVLRL